MMRRDALIFVISALSLIPALSLMPAPALGTPTQAPKPPSAAQTLTEPTPQAEPMPSAVRRPPAIAPSTQTGHRLTQQGNRHGLGLSLGMSPGFGFAYRSYFGNTVLQASVFAAVLDRGDNAIVWIGVQAAQYLLVWQQSRRRSLLPRTSALRLVGGGSYLYQRSTNSVFEAQAGCTPGFTTKCPLVTKKKTDTTQYASIGAGIGFEFGAIMRPGVSFAIDLQLTAIFDKGTFIQLWPLPSVALMYSW